MTQPTAEEVQAEWEKRRVNRPAGRGLSGPNAQVGRSAEREATCSRCERQFRYDPVMVAGVEVCPTQCLACVRETEVLLRADVDRSLDTQREAAAEARRANRLALLQQITGNAAEHRDMTIESFDDAECGAHVLRNIRDFYADVRYAGPHDPVRGLLLHGDTGNGKTHGAIAAGVSSLLLDPDVDPASVVFDRADELIMRIQDCYGRDSVFDRVLDRRFGARVWILDDLGTEKASEDAARLLTLIFSRRALRPTVVTMNGSLTDLEETRPELRRVLSRFGPRYFRVVRVDGRDRRFDA